MPKRYGKLWHPICDRYNIEIATRQVLQRRKQKGRWGQQEQYIEENFDKVCEDIQRSLTERTYEFGKIRHRSIRERRKIRVLDYLDTYHSIYLQCVLNVCQPLFIRKYIRTTYSSIKGRGLSQMSKHIWRVIKLHPDKHFILLDMSKCYQNVSHPAMNGILRHTFKDKYVLEFFEKLLELLPDGMAIGFSTNHYLVNLLFTNLDHRIEKMHGVYIFRYMDDILIIADESDLPMIYHIVNEEIDKIRQVIKSNTRFAPIDYGISMCGIVYFTDHMLLKPDIVKSMYRKDRQLRRKKVSDEEYKQGMASYWGWCKDTHAVSLFKSVLKEKQYLFKKQFEEMKRFSDIAEGNDRRERYEGEYWKKDDIVGKEVEFIKFRKTTVRGREKYIIQACIDGEYGYFFTEAIGITDKLERYSAQLPFSGTVTELTNKQGIKFMTII